MKPDAAPSNAPEWTVSELAGALKRTLEDSFGYVRLRGEVSGYRGPHGSGHAYFSLKDETACIDERAQAADRWPPLPRGEGHDLALQCRHQQLPRIGGDGALRGLGRVIPHSLFHPMMVGCDGPYSRDNCATDLPPASSAALICSFRSCGKRARLPLT